MGGRYEESKVPLAQYSLGSEKNNNKKALKTISV